MTTSKRRRESNWKSRKQNQHPHGKISSLHKLSGAADTDSKDDPST
ncbi:DUF6254 family protein [Cohnella cellulosilytica]|uniref:DUF6254 family protein n=1 Tax=Cohnella cellulosilytica TaxID=986710 RepID=A0ABW2F3P4_9BACL